MIRLSYGAKLYQATDVTYYSWYDGLWTLPEMAGGIIVACLPVLPRFFQGLKEMETLSKIKSSLELYLNFTVVASRRRTDDHSAENYMNPNAPASRSTKTRPGQYEVLSDILPLAKRSHGNLENTTFGDDEYNQPEAHIMRTIIIDTRSESKGHNRSHSPNSRAEVFQGESSSHGISVEV